MVDLMSLGAARWSRRLGWASFFVGLAPLIIAVIGKGFSLPKPPLWSQPLVGSVFGIGALLGLAATLLAARARSETTGPLRREPGPRRAATRTPDRATRWPALLGVIITAFMTAPAFVPIGRETPMGALGWIATVAALAAGAVVASSTPDVTVGLDGILVRTLFGARFFSFEGVIEATALPNGVALHHADGSRDRLLFYRLATARRLRDRDAIISLVKDALSEARVIDEPRPPDALARRGRPIAAWREAIAAVARGGYRDLGLSPEALDQTVSSAASSAEARIAAAIALSTTGEDGAKDRIRVAADACADPKVRVSLERIADGADADHVIEAALDERARVIG